MFKSRTRERFRSSKMEARARPKLKSGLNMCVRQAAARTSADAKPKEKVRMKARITVITIGVDDLERSLRFYRDGLGLATRGIVGSEFEYGAVAFLDLQSGLKLALWPRRSI